MPLQYQKLNISNFTGGITDRIIGSEAGTFDKCNCFVVTNDKRLETTYGYRALYSNVQGHTATNISELGSDTIYFTKLTPMLVEFDTDVNDNLVAGVTPISGAYGEVQKNMEVFTERWGDNLLCGVTPFMADDVAGVPSDFRHMSTLYGVDNNGETEYKYYKSA